MSDIYTHVRYNGVGYGCRGRKTREQAIAEARACYEYRLEEAKKFLEALDNDISVKVERGYHRPKLIEELKP